MREGYPPVKTHCRSCVDEDGDELCGSRKGIEKGTKQEKGHTSGRCHRDAPGDTLAGGSINQTWKKPNSSTWPIMLNISF